MTAAGLDRGQKAEFAGCPLPEAPLAPGLEWPEGDGRAQCRQGPEEVRSGVWGWWFP